MPVARVYDEADFVLRKESLSNSSLPEYMLAAAAALSGSTGVTGRREYASTATMTITAAATHSTTASATVEVDTLEYEEASASP